MNREASNQNSSNLAFDVFISYSSRNKLIADAMKQYLQSKGIRCWKAPDDIVHGESWAKAIPRAIKNSQIMVLIWTKDSMSSRQVVNELTLADRAKKLIIPFRTEEIEPEDEFEYYLAKTHWFDAFGADNDKDFDLLAQRVRRNLNESERAPQAYPENSVANSRSESSSNRAAPIDIRKHIDASEIRPNKVSEPLEEYLDCWFTVSQLRQAITSLSYYEPLIEIDLIAKKLGHKCISEVASSKLDIIGAFQFERPQTQEVILLAVGKESASVLSTSNVFSYSIQSLEIEFCRKAGDLAEISLNGDAYKVCGYREDLLDYTRDVVVFLNAYISATRAKYAARNNDLDKAIDLTRASAEFIENLCSSYDLSHNLFFGACLALNAFGDDGAHSLLDDYLLGEDPAMLREWGTIDLFLSQGIKKLHEEAAKDLITTSPPESDTNSNESGNNNYADTANKGDELDEELEVIKDSMEQALQKEGFLWDGGANLEEETIELALKTGRLKKLEELWRQMISIRETYLPSGDYLIARGVSSLSRILCACGEYDDALECALKALDMRIEGGERVSGYVTNTERLNVAKILLLMERIPEATSHLNQIIENYTRTDGSNENLWRALAAEAITLRKQLDGQ